MTLRSLALPKVQTLVVRDRRLKHIDTRVYTDLLFNPLRPIIEIARSLNCSHETIRRSVRRLIDTGWAYAHTEPNRSRGIIVVPWMPEPVERAIATELAQVRNDILYFGEWLAKCLLDWCVKDHDYRDNARPRWLVSPDDGERLELDRWYRSANVAFEFQGSQHFEKGQRFSRTGAELSRRMQLDAIKSRLCAMHKVELIELTAEDLDCYRIREKVAGKLPLIPVKETGPLFRELMGMCQSYRSRAGGFR